MRFRTTAILLAILAVVAAYFFLVENKAHRAQEEKKRTSRKLFQYESKDLDKFVLINPRGERVEVEHLGSQWRIVSPVSAPADEPTISSFIGQVVPGWKSDEVIDAGNAADFGLAKPFATLILLHRGSTVPDTLFVGDKTPTTTTCYVRIGSSGPILISREITHNVMNKGLYHFRDKTFLSFESEGVDGITIHAGARKLDLEKKGTTWWFGDRHVRADRKKVEAYLTSVAKTIIRQFTREDLDSLGLYGLSTPADEITLRHGGETTRIAFGTKTGNEVYPSAKGSTRWCGSRRSCSRRSTGASTICER